MRCNPRDEEHNLSKGSAVVDRADGHSVSICIGWRRQRPPILPVSKEEQQVNLDQGVRGDVPQAEGVPGQSLSIVQATAGYSALPVLRGNGAGNQFSPCAGTGPGAEAYILCEQSIARA